MRAITMLAAAVISTGAALSAPDLKSGQAVPSQDVARPFGPGERLVYDVKFGIFRVGRASMEVVGIETVRGEPTYHVVFTIRGRALFYSLNDSLQSWFGVNDLVSRRFIQDNEENGRQRYRHYEIHPEQGHWVRNETDTGLTVEAPLDDASFFYFARTLTLEVGQTYDLPRYFIADRNPVTLRVMARESVSTPAGRFDAFAVRPIFKSRGIFAQGGQATVWFSADEARLPVRVRSRMSIGTLDLSLRERS
jgi:hypothetical protein